MTWWWSLTRGEAEDDSGPTLPKDRLGPYDTRADAEQAFRLSAERTAAQDARDRAEDDW